MCVADREIYSMNLKSLRLLLCLVDDHQVEVTVNNLEIITDKVKSNCPVVEQFELIYILLNLVAFSFNVSLLDTL